MKFNIRLTESDPLPPHATPTAEDRGAQRSSRGSCSLSRLSTVTSTTAMEVRVRERCQDGWVMGDGKKWRMVMDTCRFMALVCSTLCPSNYSNGLVAFTEVGVWEWRWETKVFVSMCSLDSIRAFRWAMFLGDGSILKTFMRRFANSMLEGVQPRF